MDSRDHPAPYESLRDFADAFVQPGGPIAPDLSGGGVRVPPRHAGLADDPGTDLAPARPTAHAGAWDDAAATGTAVDAATGAATGILSASGGHDRERIAEHATREVWTTVDMLLEGIEALAERAVDAHRTDDVDVLGMLADRTHYLRDLLENLILVVDPQPGATLVERRPVDMSSILHDAIRNCSHEAAARAIRPQLQIPDDVPLVEADPERLERLVTSLTACVVQSSNEGSTVRLGIDVRPGMLHTWIRSDGLVADASWIDGLTPARTPSATGSSTADTSTMDASTMHASTVNAAGGVDAAAGNGEATGGTCCGPHDDCGCAHASQEGAGGNAVMTRPTMQIALDVAREITEQHGGRLHAERLDQHGCILRIELPLS